MKKIIASKPLTIGSMKVEAGVQVEVSDSDAAWLLKIGAAEPTIDEVLIPSAQLEVLTIKAEPEVTTASEVGIPTSKKKPSIA